MEAILFMGTAKRSVLVIFGTRPEAIKMCPLVLALRNRDIKVSVCVTGQHKEMLKSVLDSFEIVPDYDLAIMKPRQTLFDINIAILERLKPVLETEQPDLVIAHGDTTTTFASSLASFYLQIPVAHVEAGLRTYNIYSPFPEEFNRRAVSIIAKLNFSPTRAAANNLLEEGVDPSSIYITGNTAIDALRYTVKDDFTHPITEWAGESKLILLTAHRRENLGDSMRQMFRAVRMVAEENPDVKIVYPVHLNPAIRELVDECFSDIETVKCVDPLDVVDFHNVMARSYLILTDSGGIQEEAPALDKPVLVMRRTTERPEGIEAGTARLVGTSCEEIFKQCSALLRDASAYNAMASAVNPFGDGRACDRIADIVAEVLG